MNIDEGSKKLIQKEVVMPTAEQNLGTMKMLVRDWHLGPDKASEEPRANKQFWQSYAKVMQVPEKQARRLLCANCEYFENTPEMIGKMDKIPFNKYDADGGGRGFCHKFNFICHNLRTCQAWEYREYGSD